jgi:type IV pilus assembly protein PilN
LPRFENVADYVVRMDNLEFLANSQLDLAQLKMFTQPAVSFEVASELVTVVGENGTEVRLEGGSQEEVAGEEDSLDTTEVAQMEALNRPAAEDQYRGRTEFGRR